LSASVKLRDIYIGNIDGETESTNENFEQLFYTNNSKYDEIMRSDKYIISGRKGTGKTILASYIEKKVKRSGNICKILKKQDFQLQKLIDLQYRELQDEELTLFWKWTFLLQIGNLIVSKNRVWKKIPFTNIGKLSKFLKEKYPNDILKLKSLSTSSLKKSNLTGSGGLKNTFNPTISAGLEEQKQLNHTYENKEYFESLNTLENLIATCLLKSNEFVLIYDDIDEIENKIEKKDFYFKLLISMLETIKSLNLMFKSLNKQDSKIIVLLRSDIIDQIHPYSSNSNKFITEGKVNLYWIGKNYDSPADHPLMEMILNKIQKSVPQYNNLDKYTLLKQLFPTKIGHKDIIDYLLDYSFGRPRDITRYLKLIIDKHKEETSFQPKFFRDCTQEYSKWFLQELENEISIHEEKESITEGLKLLNNFKKNTFSFEMLEDYHKDNIDNYSKIIDLKEMLTHLYKFGVIGNSWVYKKRKGKDIYRYSWGYRDDNIGEINFSQSFVVHYGFRKHFSL
jgi:hypothetical protein